MGHSLATPGLGIPIYPIGAELDYLSRLSSSSATWWVHAQWCMSEATATMPQAQPMARFHPYWRWEKLFTLP